jgi:hypothetical protein
MSNPEDLGAIERAWLDTYTALITFLAIESRLPRENVTASDPAANQERVLGSWVRYQRRRFERNIMPSWQADLLASAIPAMTWSPYDDTWRRSLHELIRFVTDSGLMPRYRSGDDAEQRLAAWVYKMRHLYRRGLLPTEREAAIRRAPFRIL